MPNLLGSALLVTLLITALPSVDQVVAAPLRVDRDMTLDPTREYGPIVIIASHVTLDGNGATLIGAPDGDPRTFQGAAISGQNVSDVKLKNIKARGWERGLHVVDGRNWQVEQCDFSDNFHDPAFGWGENGRRGGIVLERVEHSTVRGCRANRVWDACVLVDAHHNRVLENDFSHTSNTCLKLWHACDNEVTDNNLSYGIRKDPGEVHARDSTCVLIESGSDRNRLLRNDCRYGGDGIFIRVLNGWVSTDNYLAENDCSYANNNCVEAWSPRNTWVRNRANHGSYGFWLGASDKNVLIGNEASYNGLESGNHQSPHLPDDGHAGIVFMFGPSSHTVLRDNRCEGNRGAGIAAIGDLDSRGRKWNAFHWVIEQNQLVANRWGIYLQHAEMLSLSDNRFQDNQVADVFVAENVTDLRQRLGDGTEHAPPVARLEGPAVIRLGDTATFDAAHSLDPRDRPLTFAWRMQPIAAVHAGPRWEPPLTTPGFYRLALTVDNGQRADLAYRDLYVVRAVQELGTEDDSSGWTWTDDSSQVRFDLDQQHKLLGQAALRAHVEPYGGGRVTLRFRLPAPVANLPESSRLEFWLKLRNENVPAWQDANPIVTLQGSDRANWLLTPSRDLLSEQPYLEAREGWTFFSVPVGGDETWTGTGTRPTDLAEISLGVDSWGAPPLTLWIDGLSVETSAAPERH